MRLRPTIRCRIALAFLPIVLPLNVLWWLGAATKAALGEFWKELCDQAIYTVGFWYRHVYRPARYGSIHDA